MQQISGIKIYNKILINKLHTLFPFNKVGGGEGGGDRRYKEGYK